MVTTRAKSTPLKKRETVSSLTSKRIAATKGTKNIKPTENARNVESIESSENEDEEEEEEEEEEEGSSAYTPESKKKNNNNSINNDHCDVKQLASLAALQALKSLKVKSTKTQSEDVVSVSSNAMEFKDIFPTALHSAKEETLYLDYNPTGTSSFSEIPHEGGSNVSGGQQNEAKAKKQKAIQQWGKLVTPEMTPQIEADLKLIKHRNVLDRNRHYKANDSNHLPKVFEMGTVIAGASEWYSARLTNKQRGPTMVSQILKDEQNKAYYKKKFREVQAATQKTGRRVHAKKKNRNAKR